MNLPKKALSIISAFLLLVSILANTPLAVKAEAPPENLKILSSNLDGNTTNVPRALKIILNINLPINNPQIDSEKFWLKDSHGNAVDIGWSYGDNCIILTPYEFLKPETDYNLSVLKDSFTVSDSSNNPKPLSEDFTISFKTRKDNIIKIGPHGDYANFQDNIEIFYLSQRNTPDTPIVQIEQGAYYVPRLLLANSGVAFYGGYDSTFTGQGGKNLTVLMNEERVMFDIQMGDSWSYDTVLNYSFHNLTFTRAQIANLNEAPERITPIRIYSSMKYKLNVDIEKCSFKDLLGNASWGEEQDYASPITAVISRGCTLNLNVSQSEFLNNKYTNSYSGGIFVKTLNYDYAPTITNLKVTNSIFANNNGRISGAIVGLSDAIDGLNADLYNNTIVKNDGYTEIPRLVQESSAASSGGVSFISTAPFQSIKANLTNNIIWGNKINGTPNDVLLSSEGESLAGTPSIICTMDSNNIGLINKSGNKISDNIPITLTENNTLNLDPLFKDYNKNDFHLSDASPMIDKGKTVELKNDFAGSSRPSGAGYDIGAFEAPAAAPQPSIFDFDVSALNVDETSSKATVTVKRTGRNSGKASVNYSTADGSAKSGDDFTSSSGTLIFEDGETSKTFDIAIINDTAVEQDEAFTVTLSNPSEGDKLGEIISMNINIKSDDKEVPVKPEQFIGFTVSSVSVDESSGKVTVTVNRTGSSEGKATINYNTSAGTAKLDEDFTALSGILTFEDGETSKTFDISIINDTAVEQDEAFTVTLSNPSEGTKLGEITTMNITIKSDDVQPPAATLPQTGAIIDLTVLLLGGIVLILVGVYLIRKKKLS